jgi:uncharacterized protein
VGVVEFERSKILMRQCSEEPKNVLGYGRPPAPPADYSDTIEDGLRIIRNAKVPMRDGVEIYADIYMAEGKGAAPELGAIVGWAAFGKHNTSASLPTSTGLPPGTISRHTGFEVPDPAYWCPAGYAVIYPDPRGSWNSPGDYYQGGVEIEDAYDLCEWAGVQPWSNGKVAFTGVSYPATISWQLAALNPPHLAAIMPWEGFTDMYREFAYHGGIRETGHTRLVSRVMGWMGRNTEDLARNYDAHPFYDDYWAFKNPILADITVPAYVCASWSDQGLHSRGTLEGWRGISSKAKWLQVHGRQKWAEYYKAENIARQRMFFDHFLLGKETGIDERPPVEIEVRERAFVGEVRAEQEWPLARTVHTPMFLDANTGALTETQPAAEASARYRPSEGGKILFDKTFDADTEVTGYMNLKLWVEADGSDDMDLFVAIQKYDAEGRHVDFPYFAFHTDGPVALGWLRASHRELDAQRSTPSQPVRLHARELRLSPGEIVPVEIDIWPSSTLFRAGETLRLLIQGKDIYVYEEEHSQGSHLELRNAGQHVVHTGGRYPSQILLPVIPR